MSKRAWWRIAALPVLWLVTATAGAAGLKIDIGLLMQVEEAHVPLSLLEPVIEDTGREGAEQGIRDNNTTGRFTGQEFELHPAMLAAGASPEAALHRLHEKGIRLFLVNLPAPQLVALAATPEAADSLLFNIANSDSTTLRTGRFPSMSCLRYA